MANLSTDFRVSCDHPDHYKTKHLINIAGEAAYRCQHRLWAFAAQRRPNGDLSGMPDSLIESIADWRGEPGVFIRALLESGYLEGEPGARRIHDWLEHQAYLFERAAKRKAAYETNLKRWGHRNQNQATTSPPPPPSPPSLPCPVPTLPDPYPTLPYPRSDIASDIASDNAPTPPSPQGGAVAPSAPAPGAPDKRWAASRKKKQPDPDDPDRLPYFDREAKCWRDITDERLNDWKRVYPDVDVDAELARMVEWLLANPRKATKKAWHRFIVNWLGKEQRDATNRRKQMTISRPPGRPAPAPTNALIEWGCATRVCWNWEAIPSEERKLRFGSLNLVTQRTIEALGGPHAWEVPETEVRFLRSAFLKQWEAEREALEAEVRAAVATAKEVPHA